MRTLDLRQQTVTIDELLTLSSKGDIFIFTKEGKKLLLTEPDDFDREIAQLGRSEKFMQFLATRSQNKRGRSLSEVEKALDLVQE